MCFVHVEVAEGHGFYSVAFGLCLLKCTVAKMGIARPKTEGINELVLK